MTPEKDGVILCPLRLCNQDAFPHNPGNLNVPDVQPNVPDVQPTSVNSNEGNIAYLGVVPEQRGHGYGLDLLAQATVILLKAGIDVVVARTNSHNLPMQRTFAKLGYQLESKIWTYHMSD